MSTLEEKAQEYLYDLDNNCTKNTSQVMADFAKEQISQQVKEALERAAEPYLEKYKSLEKQAHSGMLTPNTQSIYMEIARENKYTAEFILSLIKEY